MNKHSGVFWLNKTKLIAGIAKSSSAQHCTCERSATQRDFTLPKKAVILRVCNFILEVNVCTFQCLVRECSMCDLPAECEKSQ